MYSWLYDMYSFMMRCAKPTCRSHQEVYPSHINFKNNCGIKVYFILTKLNMILIYCNLLCHKWRTMYRNAHFPWRFDETAKEMRTYLGDLLKQPRKCTIYLAVWIKGQGNAHFPWCTLKTAKAITNFLGCLQNPPRNYIVLAVSKHR